MIKKNSLPWGSLDVIMAKAINFVKKGDLLSIKFIFDNEIYVGKAKIICCDGVNMNVKGIGKLEKIPRKYLNE